MGLPGIRAHWGLCGGSIPPSGPIFFIFECLKIIGANDHTKFTKRRGTDLFEDFPPPEEGLNSGEEVVWSQRAGMAARWMLGGACCIVGSPWVILLAYAALGSFVGNFLLFIVLIGLALTILEFVNSRRTRYYLTNTRIVEARGGLLQNQIPLESFQGVQLDDFLEMKSTYSEGAKTFYQARIRDPTSGKLMILTGLNENARDIILKLSE